MSWGLICTDGRLSGALKLRSPSYSREKPCFKPDSTYDTLAGCGWSRRSICSWSTLSGVGGMYWSSAGMLAAGITTAALLAVVACASRCLSTLVLWAVWCCMVVAAHRFHRCVGKKCKRGGCSLLCCGHSSDERATLYVFWTAVYLGLEIYRTAVAGLGWWCECHAMWLPISVGQSCSTVNGGPLLILAGTLCRNCILGRRGICLLSCSKIPEYCTKSIHLARVLEAVYLREDSERLVPRSPTIDLINFCFLKAKHAISVSYLKRGVIFILIEVNHWNLQKYGPKSFYECHL